MVLRYCLLVLFLNVDTLLRAFTNVTCVVQIFLSVDLTGAL